MLSTNPSNKGISIVKNTFKNNFHVLLKKNHQNSTILSNQYIYIYIYIYIFKSIISPIDLKIPFKKKKIFFKSIPYNKCIQP